MFINPYQDYEETDRPLRANFHTHAGTGKNTCGHYPIREVLRNYNRLGYDVICLSNHDRYTNPKFHGFNTPKIMLISGYEYSKTPHVVCVGTNKVIRGEGRQQDAINSTVADGGFAILAHPNWQRDWYLSKENIASYHDYTGIEILNGSMDYGRMVFKEREHRADAPDVYDYILSSGKLIWAFGNDDMHRWWSFARCWNMVYSEKNIPDFIKAIKAGKFYASSGASLRYLKLDNGVIRAAARTGEAYPCEMNFKFYGLGGKLLKEENAMEATYTIKGDEKYIRLEVTSPIGNKIYTNPVYDTDFFGEIK